LIVYTLTQRNIIIKRSTIQRKWYQRMYKCGFWQNHFYTAATYSTDIIGQPKSCSEL